MAPPDHSGKRLGKYRLIKRLGAGGMGVVYLGEHETIGKRVAIKLLLPEAAAHPDQLRRFFNEARAAARIEHPGIVNIFDCDADERLGAYLVMEFLDGEPLSQRLARVGALAPDDGASLIEAVAEPLHAAHEVGIIHRDLKPDNIFLVRSAGPRTAPRVVLLDFGIAKLAESLSSVAATAVGAVMGTPLYMSPEQCRSSTNVDRRADVYSLGVVAYEALCGRPPFVEPDFLSMLQAHVGKPPPAPRSLRPQLTPGIEQVLLRALAKAPEERFPDVVDLSAALRAAVSAGVPGAVARPVADVAATLPGPAAATMPPTAVAVPPTAGPVPRTRRGSGQGRPGLDRGDASQARRPTRPWVLLSILGLAAVSGGLFVWSQLRRTTPHAVAGSPTAGAAPPAGSVERAQPKAAAARVAGQPPRPGTPLVHISTDGIDLDGRRVVAAASVDLEVERDAIAPLLERLALRARQIADPDPRGRGHREIRICAARDADLRLVGLTIYTCAFKAGFGQLYLGVSATTGGSPAFSIVDAQSGCSLIRLAAPLTRSLVALLMDVFKERRYTLHGPASKSEIPAKGGRFDNDGLHRSLKQIQASSPGNLPVILTPYAGVSWSEVISAMDVLAAAGYPTQFVDPHGPLPPPRPTLPPVAPPPPDASPPRSARPSRIARSAPRHAASRSTPVIGSLGREEIQRTIRAHIDEVQDCYQEGLARVTRLYGRVEVQFTIAAEGQVVTARVTASTLGDPTVERCIVRAAKRWTFPKPRGGGTVIVSYPFALRTADSPRP